MKHRQKGSFSSRYGKISFMLTILLLVLLVALLFGGIGPRYYRGRGRRTVVREYDTY